MPLTRPVIGASERSDHLIALGARQWRTDRRDPGLTIGGVTGALAAMPASMLAPVALVAGLRRRK